MLLVTDDRNVLELLDGSHDVEPHPFRELRYEEFSKFVRLETGNDVVHVFGFDRDDYVSAPKFVVRHAVYLQDQRLVRKKSNFEREEQTNKPIPEK